MLDEEEKLTDEKEIQTQKRPQLISSRVQNTAIAVKNVGSLKSLYQE